MLSTKQEEDPNFDRKLDLITAGASPFIRDHLLTKISRENCLVIIDYVLAFQTEVSPSQKYRIDTIYKLKQLAEFHKPKSFRDMTREDIVEFLDHLRKPESVDPLHQWKGSYEIARIILIRLFKWLYYPNFSPHTKRPKPEIVQNIPQIKRLEKSIYKPTDLWTEEDDVLFYKYCPSLRDKCLWAVLRDTGCRVHELLKLRIKDVIIERLDSGYHSARITVNGKTGTRNITITNSYPYLKEWLTHGHPYGSNPNAPLFCGVGKKTFGKRIANTHSIHSIYAHHYKKIVFPKVLEDPLVPEEEKRKIRELLQKPWNPHARRHTAATEVSKAFKDSVLIDQYMGWSRTGNTRVKYQHYFSDDAHIAKLEADGFLPKGSSDAAKKRKELLRPKSCPNCSEPNKPDSKFCSKCKFVLTFDAFNEVTQESERAKQQMDKLLEKELEKDKQIDYLTKEYERMNEVLTKTTSTMSSMLEMFEDQQNRGGKSVSAQKYFKFTSDAISSMKAVSLADGLSEKDFYILLDDAMHRNRAEMEKRLKKARGNSKRLKETDKRLIIAMEVIAERLRNDEKFVTEFYKGHIK